TMAQARLDDGQLLLALTEIFIGHSSHQSARYRLATAAGDEHHSSSGVIVSTGTGASGWARSINRERRESLSLPRPTEARLAYFVREAFPGSGFVATTTAGHITRDQHLDLVSEMNAGGAIFGDGIEADHLAFPFGSRVELRVAPRALKLAA
ncbi:MAG TPA: hypothetical protein VMB20_00780, partial [Candidatus Acidoferrum sp.]|nr:hypothetical protein [Candidatus Acidoferrum sp.]